MRLLNIITFIIINTIHMLVERSAKTFTLHMQKVIKFRKKIITFTFLMYHHGPISLFNSVITNIAFVILWSI